jgi:general secretion pathway protein K
MLLFRRIHVAAVREDAPRPRERPASAAGSALILVLWVVGLLAIMISSFAFDMHLEAIQTSYNRKRLKAEYLARSGLEIVKLIHNRSQSIKDNAEGDAEISGDPWYGYARAIRHGGAIHIEDALGAGAIALDITPEPARRNVNSLDKTDWEGVLEVGEVPEELWDTLIDCFNDWKDPDSDLRPNGAETDDYYGKLEPPYKARNGTLETIEELLLIKGFARPVVYGGLPPGADEETEPISGIADMLTTYGDTNNTVNVNAASKRILMSLPGVDDLMADEIIAQREGLTEDAKNDEDMHFKSWDDFHRRIPDAPPELKNKIAFSSAIYRITSSGVVSGVRRVISCIVTFDGKSNMTILRWNEEEGS